MFYRFYHSFFGGAFVLAMVLFPLHVPEVNRRAEDSGLGFYRPAVEGSFSWLSPEQVEQILSKRVDTKNPRQVTVLAHHLIELCHRYRLDPAFVLSVIQVESAFNARAVSPMGAVGLMQLMPATAGVVLRDYHPPMDDHPMLRKVQQLFDGKTTIRPALLMDPVVNVTLGVAYLASLRDKYRRMNPYFVLAAYNMGPARMDQLISKKAFRPDKTRKYFEAIRQATFAFRAARIRI